MSVRYAGFFIYYCMTALETILPLVQEHLFSSVDEMKQAKVQPRVRDRILRIREFYTYWLRYPRTADKDIVKMIMDRYGLGATQAYFDLRLVKHCLGALNTLTKEYDRYLFRQRCEEGWEMAREAGDVKAFAAVISAYVKGTGLDKDELTRPDYSSIVPQTFTITSDPSASGFRVVPGILEKAKKMEARYMQEAEIVPEYTEETSTS